MWIVGHAGSAHAGLCPGSMWPWAWSLLTLDYGGSWQSKRPNSGTGHVQGGPSSGLFRLVCLLLGPTQNSGPCSSPSCVAFLCPQSHLSPAWRSLGSHFPCCPRPSPRCPASSVWASLPVPAAATMKPRPLPPVTPLSRPRHSHQGNSPVWGPGAPSRPPGTQR